MAQKVDISLVDDIDESEASETVLFAVDGKSYAIDLNEEHAAALRDSLALYLANARLVDSAKAAVKKSPRSLSDAGAIRKWARANKLEVSERGRISSEVRDAYAAAH